MVKIGVLSDTHAYLHPKVFDFFASCDEIWHCGDIGSSEVLEQLTSFKPLRAVYGNIDGQDIRNTCNEKEIFSIEETKVCMTHIGGYPPRYNPTSLQLIKTHKPTIFVCGHSHILRVMYDATYKLLYINPGAAGMQGFHNLITFLRFDIINNTPSAMEIFQTEKNKNITY
ncbi:MAG: metallophosphoesterase family protein [Bacteroidales bacterium]|nr:metallophosphoesterase family protein [Bacteroidales bacterium]